MENVYVMGNSRQPFKPNKETVVRNPAISEIIPEKKKLIFTLSLGS